MVILGISAYYHDSAAAILVDGKIIAASCEERFSRIKHDQSFPSKAIIFCLKEAEVSYSQIDYVVFYEKPLIKFERILSSHIYHAPKGIDTFIKSIPIWLKEKLNLKKTIAKELNKTLNGKRSWDIRFVEHHLSHAAMAYYTSGYKDAAILVIDAVGEKATTSILKGSGNKIEFIKQQVFPNSIGLLYSSFTYFLGFKVNSDEYKVMGLAPYGVLMAKQTQEYINTIEQELINIDEDGSIMLNQEYFTFMYGMKMINVHKWEKIFKMQQRKEQELTQAHMNLAAAIQHVTEKIILRLARHAKKITNSENLCISGGCALNCAAMGVIKNRELFKRTFIPFAPGDEGGSIGACLLLNSLLGNSSDKSITPYLGPSFADEEIITALEKFSFRNKYLEGKELYTKVAEYLSEGKIIGWFQGKMEFGPRALGNRSILADPRDEKMKDIVNARIKFRESFRPFAPVVLEEDAVKYFGMKFAPYMTFTTEVKADSIPAVTHIDNTARLQTVNEKQNARLYKLLKEFKAQTNCSVLLNTSFNVMGEPIVCTPEDAIRTFEKSGIDILVINNYIIEK